MTDVLDEALQAISVTAPDLGNGNTNHAPMVAETLASIGHGDSVLSWVERYQRTTGSQERPSARPAFAGDWRQPLGQHRLWAEWVSVFQQELEENHWTDVLEAWLPRLAPGLSGEASHGLIRTAHAVRALGAWETEARLSELADGLAYWAAGYHAFAPAPPQRTRLSLEDALLRVPMAEVDTSGNVDDAIRRLGPSREFAPVVNLLATGRDPMADLSRLTECFAAVYLSNAYDASRTFAVVHAFTGPAALRMIAPHVSRSTLALLLLYAWQDAAAIYGIWARDREPWHDINGTQYDEYALDDLTEASVANGAAHAIKFVDACLREYEHNPAPVYLAAASDAVRRLEG